MELINQLREIAKNLIENNQVDFVLGYCDGYESTQWPGFIRNIDEAEKLTFSPFSYFNLARYLPYTKKRVGVVVKGCDSRSVVQLIKENKVDRDKIKIIGINCSGVIDKQKLISNGLCMDDLKKSGVTDTKVTLETDKEVKEFSREQLLMEKCVNCLYPNPVLADITIGQLKKPALAPVKTKATEKLLAMSLKEREQFWEEQFSSCNRCSACRNICPMCYCHDECAINQRYPRWLSNRIDAKNNLIFHMIRALHLAGRCTNCGECERVCPMHIPLSSIYEQMSFEINDAYGYIPGLDLNTPLLLSSFTEDDPEAK